MGKLIPVVIIGGSGFIGTRLCNRFLRNNIPFSIIDKFPSVDHSRRVKIADVRSSDQLRECISSNSVIFNLAAEHRDDVSPRSLYDDVNVGGATNICKVAREKNINKIIFTSSVAVYGFAPLGTGELGKISPFNDYGRTKWEAEQVYTEWQAEDPLNRTLVIVRPTVVFGESNRGNVYNLLKQIASGKFVMVGNGLNRKSMAYVENLTAFLEFSLGFKPGIHIYNYIDKPDFSMNMLISHVNMLLGRSPDIKLRIPFFIGLLLGHTCDLVSKITGIKFPISAVRVKKFCANSIYESAIHSTGFKPPAPLLEAIEKTIAYEFIEDHKTEKVFYSE